MNPEKLNIISHNTNNDMKLPHVSFNKHSPRSFNTTNLNSESHNTIVNHSDNTKPKPFTCTFKGCSNGYSSKSRLSIHMRTHTGEKPFECNICFKKFNEKGNLKIHYRIHTGEKPYNCTFSDCEKSFKVYGHLNDHLKRHYNIKPFKCEMCTNTFSRRNTLKTHNLIHTGEKPHKCTFTGCNKRFSEKGNMKTHFKTHYKKLMTDLPISTVNCVNNSIICANNYNYIEQELKDNLLNTTFQTNFFEIDQKFDQFLNNYTDNTNINCTHYSSQDDFYLNDDILTLSPWLKK